VFVIIVVAFVVLGVWHELENPSECHYICSSCGAVSKSFIPAWSKRKNSCPVCSHSQLVPAGTPRGRELMEVYHGAASAHGHTRTATEAAGKLAEKLEGAERPSGTADELEELARLVQEGALTEDEWQRARARDIEQAQGQASRSYRTGR
jgi:DNA-directed RNA polymerase subunit RPC12/RpoP